MPALSSTGPSPGFSGSRHCARCVAGKKSYHEKKSAGNIPTPSAPCRRPYLALCPHSIVAKTDQGAVGGGSSSPRDATLLPTYPQSAGSCAAVHARTPHGLLPSVRLTTVSLRSRASVTQPMMTQIMPQCRSASADSHACQSSAMIRDSRLPSAAVAVGSISILRVCTHTMVCARM